MKSTLALTDLEAFDPRSPQRSGERRFLCPLCGEDKPKDSAHRSLCVNSSNGLYHCKRCNSKGRLKEFWEEKSSVNRSQIVARQLRRAFNVESPVEINISKGDWQSLWEIAQPLEKSDRHCAAVRYLKERGVTFEIAHDSDVCFVSDWHGRATLAFPFKSPDGEVVALAGRALSNGGVDKPASGPKKTGAFFAAALGFKALANALPAIILCEAPFDALSLAMAGYPSLALGGTAAPSWLYQQCAFRHILLAFDADVAGDTAAEKIGVTLASFGATCQRLRPQGAKDWNELLQNAGSEAIEEAVAPIYSKMWI